MAQTLATTAQKTCTVCKQSKPLAEFVKSARRHDGHLSHCQQCHNEKYKKTKQVRGVVKDPLDGFFEEPAPVPDIVEAIEEGRTERDAQVSTFDPPFDPVAIQEELKSAPVVGSPGLLVPEPDASAIMRAHADGVAIPMTPITLSESDQEVLDFQAQAARAIGLPIPVPAPVVQDGAIAQVIQAVNQAEFTLDSALALIPKCTYEQLLALGGRITEQIQRLWLFRGAVVYEVQERVRARCQMNRADSDTPIRDAMQELANLWGIESIKTLETDVRCYRAFYAEQIRAFAALAQDSVQADTSGSPETPSEGNPPPSMSITISPLSREFHEIATRAPDPQAALAHAEEQKAFGNHYTTRDFARYVEEQKALAQKSAPTASSTENASSESTQATGEKRTVLEQYTWQNLPISIRAYKTLRLLSQQLGCDMGRVLDFVFTLCESAVSLEQKAVLLDREQWERLESYRATYNNSRPGKRAVSLAEYIAINLLGDE